MNHLKLSVVIPCLNEAETIERAVRLAKEGIARCALDGEVVVADNGSSDDSQQLAISAGARVVKVATKGYGAALDGGFRAALGEVVVFGDADLSYPFDEMHLIVKPLFAGEADFVLGNRLVLPMEKQAMPWLNRHVGTPTISWLIRVVLGIPAYDCNSGMRAFFRKDYERLGLQSPGMEFASEMIISVAEQKLRYLEVPIPFRKDKRGKPPHLKRWRDGWRHLRFVLSCAPTSITVILPLALSLVGLGIAFVISLGEFVWPDQPIHFHSAFLLISVSGPLLIFAFSQFLIKSIRQEYGRGQSHVVAIFQKFAADSSPFYWSMALFGLVVAQAGWVFWTWAANDFGDLSEVGGVIRAMVLATLATSLLSLDMAVGVLQIHTRSRS